MVLGGSRERALLGLGLLLACALITAPASAALRLEPVVGPAGAGQPFLSPGGAGPMYVASPPGDTHRLMVGTRDGYLYAIVDGVLRSQPYADLHALTGTDDANGLQSFAFDANYATNGLVYVMYSDLDDTDPATPVEPSEFRDLKVDVLKRSAADPDRVDPASRRNVLTVPALWDGACIATTAHHGGQLQVGEDGNLWISVGDGGDGCGAHFLASQLTTLRGKILRITPQEGGGYDIPASNPLTGPAGVRREIWAYGLRNPWRFAVDRAHDELVVADVGDTHFEEVDVLPTTLPAGAPPPFFGWGCFEAAAVVYSPCNQVQTPTAPVLTFAHGLAPCTSIIGGVVVDDPSLGAAYQGRYLYGYFCASALGADGGSSRLLSVDLHAATPTVRGEGLNITAPGAGAGVGLNSFGEDACGHPYAMNVITGWLFRIEGDTPGPCGQFRPPQTTIDQAPSGPVDTSTAQVTFHASVRGATFTCALDSRAPVACTSPVTFADLPEGDHTLEIAGSDEAGNVDATPARAAWHTDGLPPRTWIVSAPSGVVSETAASIAFGVEDGDARCSLDDAPAQPCTSPVSYAGLTPGAHRVTVTAVDAFGRAPVSPAAAAWEVAQPPEPPIFPADDPGGNPVPVPTPPPVLALSGGQRLRLAQTGRLVLTANGFARAGTLVVSLGRGKTEVGRSRPVAVVPGRAVTLGVTLRRAERRLLARRGRLGVKVTLVVTAGGAQQRATAAITILRPRR